VIREGEGFTVKQMQGGEESRKVIGLRANVGNVDPSSSAGKPFTQKGEHKVGRCFEAVGKGKGSTT
jgi:hypothetical protein